MGRREGFDLEWRNNRCFIRVYEPGGKTTLLRIDPTTGQMIDISGAKVVNSDVSIAELALRHTGEQRNTDLIPRLKNWWWSTGSD